MKAGSVEVITQRLLRMWSRLRMGAVIAALFVMFLAWGAIYSEEYFSVKAPVPTKAEMAEQVKQHRKRAEQRRLECLDGKIPAPCDSREATEEELKQHRKRAEQRQLKAERGRQLAAQQKADALNEDIQASERHRKRAEATLACENAISRELRDRHDEVLRLVRQGRIRWDVNGEIKYKGSTFNSDGKLVSAGWAYDLEWWLC